MHCVLRALSWVRLVLFGPPERDCRVARGTSISTTLTPLPGLPVQRLSPEMWAAILAGARRRRTPGPWSSAEPPAITAGDIGSTLVGAYLLLPEARQRALSAARFGEAT